MTGPNTYLTFSPFFAREIPRDPLFIKEEDEAVFQQSYIPPHLCCNILPKYYQRQISTMEAL